MANIVPLFDAPAATSAKTTPATGKNIVPLFEPTKPEDEKVTPWSFIKDRWNATMPSASDVAKAATDMNFWDEVQKKFVNTTVGTVQQAADLTVGTIKSIAGLPVYVGGYAGAFAGGANDKVAAKAAMMAKDEVLPATLFAPWSVVAENLGPRAKEIYNDNPIGWVMNYIGEAVEKGADKAATKSGIAPEHFMELVDATMGWAGFKGLKNPVVNAFTARAKQVLPKPFTQKFDFAEPAVQGPPAPEMRPSWEKAAAPYALDPATGKPWRAGPQAVEITTPKQVKQIFDAVKTQDNLAVDSAQLKAIFDRVKNGEPMLPARPAVTRTEAAAPVDPTTSALPPMRPVEPKAETKINEGLTTAVLLNEQGKVAPESPFMTGLEKLKAGQAFLMDAQEKLALREVEKATGQLIDKKGKPLKQFGAVDSELLAKIAAAGGALAYLAVNPSDAEALALLALGAGNLKGVGEKVGTATKAVPGFAEARPLSEFRGPDKVETAVKPVAKRDYAEDKALIEEFRQGGKIGDRAASKIYEANKGQLERSVRSFAKEGLDVEQIVNDTFAKAFNSLKATPEEGGFRGESALSSYLYGIAKNVALDELRAVKTEGRTPESGYQAFTELTPEIIKTEHGHGLTPERELLNKQIAQRMSDAIEALPEQQKEVFKLREFEGLDYEQIAEQTNTPINTVRTRLNRARENLQASLREFDDGQGGFADTKTLATIAAVGGGAALAYQLGAMNNSDKPLRDVIAGAIGGALIGTGAGRKFIEHPVKQLDKNIGLIDTRLDLLVPGANLGLVQRNFERSVMQSVGDALKAATPFVDKFLKLPLDVQDFIAGALRNGDRSVLKAYPELEADFKPVVKLLDSIETQLKGLGRFAKGVADYFPRSIRDLDGLMEALGKDVQVGLEARLAKAELEMGAKKLRPMTELERDIVINDYLFRPDPTSGLPGYAKSRGLDVIPDELQHFYEDLPTTLTKYLSAAVNDIETAKFMGQDLKTSLNGKRAYTDVQGSIEAKVARIVSEHKVGSDAMKELRDIWQARFGPGEQAVGPIQQNFRNITNAALLGQIGSAATQIGDVMMLPWHFGIVPATRAVFEQATRKTKLTPDMIGLVSHAGEELARQGLTSRNFSRLLKDPTYANFSDVARHASQSYLEGVLKYSGFQALDLFAKGVGLNAGLLDARSRLSTPAGNALLDARYGELFGPEWTQVKADLLARKDTVGTRLIAFDRLSDAYPVSKAQTSEGLLANPGNRWMGQLKSYVMKQADIIRVNSYEKIKSGDPQLMRQGVTALLSLGGMYAIAGVPADAVKDFLSGRETQPITSQKLLENVLQNFGMSRYALDRISQGKFTDQAASMITPPISVINDLLTANEKSVSYIPVIGRQLYDIEGPGNVKREIAEAIRHNKQALRDPVTGKPLPGEAKLLSEEAKQYIKEKRMKAAEKKAAENLKRLENQ